MEHLALLIVVTSPPELPPGAPDGPLSRVLVDPAGTMRAAVASLGDGAARLVPWLMAATVAAAAVLAVLAILGRRRQARMVEGARVVTILAPPEVDPAGGEALWANLHAILRPRWSRFLRGQPHLSFEYAWSVAGLRISMWVPGAVPPGMVERAIESAWPAARTETRWVAKPAATGKPDDQCASELAVPPLPSEWTVNGGALRLAAPGWLPLRTDFDADPIRALVGAGAGQSDEAAVVQVLARPAGPRAVAGCRRAASAIRQGRPARRGLALLDVLTPGPTSRPPVDPNAAAEIRAILDKAASPLWAVSLRYAVAVPEHASDVARRRMRGRAHALASSFAGYAGRNRLVRRRLRKLGPVVAARSLGHTDLLSVPELAALAHLPLDRIVPSLTRAGARPVPPSPAVPSKPDDGKVLGLSDAAGRRPVVLPVADSRYHLHVMGATGSGKSTLLTHLILGDIAKGRGVVVVDPKGDLVTDVLARLTPAQTAKVVLLDPQVKENRPKLNVLEVPDGIEVDLVVDNVVGIFSRIFESSWGPRLEDVLRSACLTVLQQHGTPGAGTLVEIPKLLTETGRQARFLKTDSPEELVGFWKWYDAMSEAQRAQVVGPLIYKLRAFLMREFVRDIVKERESTVDLGQVLNGGILLVRVPKGILGEDTARLLGSFVVAKTWQAAIARASTPAEDRNDASLYVDECQNFLNLPRSFDEILAEARGYRLSLVLAHQHLGQLPRDLRDAVSANARNKVLFTMSPEDAFVLSRHTSPQLTDHDLANLDGYQAAARLVVAGKDQPAFTLRTLAPAQAR